MPYIASSLYSSEGRTGTGQALLELLNFLLLCNKSSVNVSHRLNFVFLTLRRFKHYCVLLMYLSVSYDYVNVMHTLYKQLHACELKEQSYEVLFCPVCRFARGYLLTCDVECFY